MKKTGGITYRLFGFPTQNTIKTLYVLEEVGVKYDFRPIDLFKGENKTDEFLKLNPFGKVPTLQYNGHEGLFESGAICRFVANNENSSLYPADHLERGKVDQWMDFFSCHLGRWLSTLYFEKIIKSKANMGQPDEEKCKEAIKFAHQQFSIINNFLANRKYFVGEEISIADLFAFAYIEQVHSYDLPIAQHTHITRWFDEIEKRESISKVRKMIKP